MSGSGWIEFGLHTALHLDQQTQGKCTDRGIWEFPWKCVWCSNSTKNRKVLCAKGLLRKSNEGGYGSVNGKGHHSLQVHLFSVWLEMLNCRVQLENFSRAFSASCSYLSLMSRSTFGITNLVTKQTPRDQVLTITMPDNKLSIWTVIFDSYMVIMVD